MNLRAPVLGVAALLLAGPFEPAGAQVFFPKPVEFHQLAASPFASVGYLDVEFEEHFSRGSAAVVRHPGVLYTCGHNVLDEDGLTPALGVAFSRSWHGNKEPPQAGLVPLRGFDPLATYATAVIEHGSDSDEGFANDFAVAWTNSGIPLGVPLPALDDGSLALTAAGVSKMIVGYPSRLDFNRRSGRFLMHVTGPLERKFQETLPGFFEMVQLSTGPGNSGGPVLVQEDGAWRVAGVLVAGAGRGANVSAGVFGIGPLAHNLATAAMLKAEEGNGSNNPPSVDEEFTASSERVAVLRGGRGFIGRPLVFRRISTYLTDARLSLEIESAARGNLHVFLRAPSGRVMPVTSPDPAIVSPGLVLVNEPIAGVFFASNPNGRWRLFMRDTVRGTNSVFRRAELAVNVR